VVRRAVAAQPLVVVRGRFALIHVELELAAGRGRTRWPDRTPAAARAVSLVLLHAGSLPSGRSRPRAPEEETMFRRSRPGATAPAAVEPEAVDAPAVPVLDDDSFLDMTEGGWTIVDFWASWCAPCKAFAPVFRAVAAAHDGPVRFASCDVDANPRTAQLLQIRSIPTLVVFGPDGSEVGRSTGPVRRGDLEATVAQLSER
jgi:thioredoxin 1